MSDLNPISKARISELAKLRQKKFRLQEGKIVLEGSRLLQQMASYELKPFEIYYADRSQFRLPYDVPAYLVQEQDFKRICDSEHPPALAALYPVPKESVKPFQQALYLDGVSDPGNMGTIFRLAAAFEIKQIFLSPECCEIANPKVIRASMGAVYHIAHKTLSHAQLLAHPSTKLYLDMNARVPLQKHILSPDPSVYILGSEAHGVSKELIHPTHQSLRIEISRGMESLNVAITAGILCHHLFALGNNYSA